MPGFRSWFSVLYTKLRSSNTFYIEIRLDVYLREFVPLNRYDGNGLAIRFVSIRISNPYRECP